MRAKGTSIHLATIGAALALWSINPALSATKPPQSSASHRVSADTVENHTMHVVALSIHGMKGKSHVASLRGSGGGGIQCVTFARAASGIELAGNAADWWYNAAGVYDRGGRPEMGSVLNFRANGRMRLGHVAVVTSVINSREIEIDHANWSGPGAMRGGVSRAVSVVDVSPENDWSAVRVGLGAPGQYGSIYPTYGFIYARPAGDAAPRTMEAAAAPLPEMNTPPRDLRPGAERVRGTVHRGFEQVAEAPPSRRAQKVASTHE